MFECVNKILVSHIGANGWLYFNETENLSTLLELKPWTIQPVASHYTDYIIPTPWLAN